MPAWRKRPKSWLREKLDQDRATFDTGSQSEKDWKIIAHCIATFTLDRTLHIVGPLLPWTQPWLSESVTSTILAGFVQIVACYAFVKVASAGAAKVKFTSGDYSLPWSEIWLISVNAAVALAVLIGLLELGSAMGLYIFTSKQELKWAPGLDPPRWLRIFVAFKVLKLYRLSDRLLRDSLDIDRNE